jgi:hypothetical protein
MVVCCCVTCAGGAIRGSEVWRGPASWALGAGVAEVPLVAYYRSTGQQHTPGQLFVEARHAYVDGIQIHIQGSGTRAIQLYPATAGEIPKALLASSWCRLALS